MGVEDSDMSAGWLVLALVACSIIYIEFVISFVVKIVC
jgi:hypothetical protein